MTDIYLKNLWLWKCGLPEAEQKKIPSFADLVKSEWSYKFEQLMRNRLIMGAIRYGRLHEKDKPKYDRVESMITRLQKYSTDGNKEHLVDVANLCLCEFEESNNTLRPIDDGEHVKVIL